MTEHLKEEQRNSTLAEARKIVAKMYAERKGKIQDRKAFWEEYYDQLKKGNSNMNKGAKKARGRGRAHAISYDDNDNR